MRAAILATAILAMATAAPGYQDKGGKKGKVPAAAPLKPEELERKVAEILDSFTGERSFSSDDPRVDRLISLGHDAIPHILDRLRKNHGDERRHSFAVSASARALERLATEADIPAIAAVLEEGLTEIAGSLRGLPAEKVRPALLAPLRKGWCSHELLEALERHRDDAGTRKAVREYLEKFGGAVDHVAGEAAAWLGSSGDAESLPVLRKLLAEGGQETDGACQVAIALAALGDKEGIGALVGIFARARKPFTGSGYDRHRAGEALNRILGERIYIGSFGPENPKGNFDEAAPRFTAWWEEVKEKIRFDGKASRWVWK